MFPDHEPIFTTLADRAVFPPWGLFDGDDGRPARYLAITGDEVTPIASKGTAPVEGGTMIRVETCGGGGYGPAWERNPELVLRDVLEEKISVERARDVYGVVIDAAEGSIHLVRTEDRRRKLREQANPS